MRILAPIQPLLCEAVQNNSSYLVYPHKILKAKLVINIFI